MPTPITREEMFLKKAADTVHGIEVESLSVTDNGIYTAPSGKAYTPVNVNVPLPANAYLLEEVTDGDLTSAKSKPLPSVSVAVTDADELDVFVGDSETVTSDNEPYIYRQSKGGRMVSERLVGASVAWNQLVDTKQGTSQGITASIDANGIITLSGITSATYSSCTKSVTLIVGHKYYIASRYIANPANLENMYWGFLNASSTPSFGSKKIGTAGIFVCDTVDGSSTGFAGFAANTDISGTKLQVISTDLTLLFGSTIADYVYSLERSTAGSGIAWLKSYGFFSEDYYAYDSGSLKSVSVSEKKVRDASDNVIATYPLPSSDLRGLYKLASNKLYADGDIQYGDGWRLRRYGIVDLGTLRLDICSDNA